MASLALASRGDYSHLRAAAAAGDVHFIRAFLRDRDAFDLARCVNDAEDDGCTALWHASARGHADAVAELIAHGASTEKARHGGATPLIVASRRGHLGAVRALVDARADLRATCPGEGRAPLHLAADGGHEAVCGVLLAAGADPTAEDAKGMTPCMVAAHRGDAAVLRCLVHHDKRLGAQLFDARHNFRTAALLLAAADGDAQGVRALLSAGSDSRRAASSLHAALCGGELASARVLEVLAKGANADAAAPVVDETSLHFAARTGSTGVTRALLDAAPIDVNAVDAAGRTPLHVAATHGHAVVVEALIAAGADASVKEKDGGCTALHRAARGGHLDCVRALCGADGRGCDVNARDDHWGTPLHAAVGEGHVAVVDWLLARRGRRRRRGESRHVRAAARVGAMGGREGDGDPVVSRRVARETNQTGPDAVARGGGGVRGDVARIRGGGVRALAARLRRRRFHTRGFEANPAAAAGRTGRGRGLVRPSRGPGASGRHRRCAPRDGRVRRGRAVLRGGKHPAVPGGSMGARGVGEKVDRRRRRRRRRA